MDPIETIASTYPFAQNWTTCGFWVVVADGGRKVGRVCKDDPGVGSVELEVGTGGVDDDA